MKLSKPMIASVVIATLMASHAAAQAAQDTFSSPQAAAEALAKAAESFDVPSLLRILGPANTDLVVSDDPVVDKTRATDFARLARESSSLTWIRRIRIVRSWWLETPDGRYRFLWSSKTESGLTTRIRGASGYCCAVLVKTNLTPFESAVVS